MIRSETCVQFYYSIKMVFYGKNTLKFRRTISLSQPCKAAKETWDGLDACFHKSIRTCVYQNQIKFCFTGFGDMYPHENNSADCAIQKNKWGLLESKAAFFYVCTKWKSSLPVIYISLQKVQRATLNCANYNDSH